MQRLETRLGILACLLAACIAVLAAVELRDRLPKKPVDIYRLPLTIGGWQGRELYVRDEVKALLETRSVMMREYSSGGARVDLALVYYKDSRVALHLPESCYTGQGSEIVARTRERLGGFDANRLTLEGNKGNQIILYYFETGRLRTASYPAMRLAMLRNRLLGRNTGCALVRCSIDRRGEPARDLQALKEFALQVDRELPRYLP